MTVGETTDNIMADPGPGAPKTSVEFKVRCSMVCLCIGYAG